MESLIRTADRQGLLKGDLNIVPYSTLNWLMSSEISDAVEMERSRIEMNALAANAHTNPQLLKHLQSLREDEEKGEEVEWLTPQSDEDINEILSEFGELPWG